MSYQAKVILDSVSPAGKRLTTIEVRYPHAVHKDIMTHRALSRNFLSFRAYPTEKLYDMLSDENCYIPEIFQAREKGMSGGSPLTSAGQEEARRLWLFSKNMALHATKALVDLGVAKEQANIPIQDYCWITGIISATNWENFFALRLDTHADGRPKARPEVFKIVSMMKAALETSEPQLLNYGEWATPYVFDSEIAECPDQDHWKKVSVGRCARISYLTHDGVRDSDQDVILHDNLCGDFHMSPFEHVAKPYSGGVMDLLNMQHSNFDGWVQYRKQIPGEANYTSTKEMDLA